MEFPKRTTNKMKHNSILQYLSNREVGNVSVNRRYDLKFALNMRTELALYHYNDVFQKQLIYHLNKIIDWLFFLEIPWWYLKYKYARCQRLKFLRMPWFGISKLNVCSI
jgi:hypothetical protein